MRLDVQQLERRHSRLPGDVLQDFEPRSTVLVELGADVEEGLARPAELLPGDALVQLLPRHTLALFQQVEVVPAHTHTDLSQSATHSGFCVYQTWC